MKHLLFIFVLFSGITSLNAQDLIVTVNRDSLNCKLGELKDDYYPIDFIMDEELMTGLIHKDSILFFRKDVFRNMRSNRLRKWYSYLEIGVDAGVGHQYGPFRVDEDLTDKSNFGARTGFYTGADMTFYVSKTIGYGIKYNYRSLLDGDIFYQYVGAMMSFRFWNKNRRDNFFLTFSGGWGWMEQKNAPIQLYLIRPRIDMYAYSTVGDLCVGYNFRLSKNISARIKLSGMIGYPRFVRIYDISKIVSPNEAPLEIGNYCHNMNTVNLSAGFTFHRR
jgi:hypothetical protein